MRSFLEYLPPQYTMVLGNISLPRDDGRSIINDVKNGTLITESDGYINGSLLAYGYMILPTRKNW